MTTTGHRIAISGVSSFTGMWIAHELAVQGYEVHGLCTREPEEYIGLRKQRIHFLIQSGVILHGCLKAEDGSFIDWIENYKPKIWIHHHHHMENFRSLDYDVVRSIQVGLSPLSGLVNSLEKNGCFGIIASGTYFEPGEGGQPTDAVVTPYAKSKAQAWDELLKFVSRTSMSLCKIIIPNPIGPMENEDRLIPVLVSRSEKSQNFILSTPNSTGVNLPVELLAAAYIDKVKEILDHPRGLKEGIRTVVRPALDPESNSNFIQRVASCLIRERLGLGPCVVQYPDQEPTVRHYSNGVRSVDFFDWGNFWDHYADHIKLQSR